MPGSTDVFNGFDDQVVDEYLVLTADVQHYSVVAHAILLTPQLSFLGNENDHPRNSSFVVLYRLSEVSNNTVCPVDEIRELDRVTLQDRSVNSVDLCPDNWAAVIGTQPHANLRGSNLQVEKGRNHD
jgi:hypothetical protein